MDFDVFTVLTSELRLATLVELQSVYNTEDLHDFLEIIEVDRELKEIARIQAKQQEAAEA